MVNDQRVAKKRVQMGRLRQQRWMRLCKLYIATYEVTLYHIETSTKPEAT